jgi:ribose 1,5-bisphosphokinase PhnN
MRHCSVQVRGLLTRDELDRYNALIEVGHFLEAEKRYDHVAVVQKEIDILILPAIERLKEKGRQRDRDTEEYLARKAQMEAELKAALRDDEDEE